jgi:putative membrane protein
MLKDLFGIGTGSTTPPDVDASKDLALERTAMAAERTLLAWIRTALAMISFGFTIGKLGQALATIKVHVLGSERDLDDVAYYLVVIGTLSLIVAMIQNQIEVAALVRHGLKRRHRLAFVVALLLSLLGMIAFTDLVTQI